MMQFIKKQKMIMTKTQNSLYVLLIMSLGQVAILDLFIQTINSIYLLFINYFIYQLFYLLTI